MFRTINPAAVRAPFASYSHAVVVPAGATWLVASGQLGVTHDDIVPAEFDRQAELCFEAIGHILAGAGMGFGDVVRLNGFVTDRRYFVPYGRVRGRYMPSDRFASTLVIVAGFTRPEFLVEIEATAAKVL